MREKNGERKGRGVKERARIGRGIGGRYDRGQSKKEEREKEEEREGKRWAEGKGKDEREEEIREGGKYGRNANNGEKVNHPLPMLMFT